MRTVPYRAELVAFTDHYCPNKQIGSGFDPYRSGLYAQRGFGGFGGVISSLLKAAVPLFKKKIIPYVTKKALRSTTDVVGDLTRGKNIKTALKNTTKKRLGELFDFQQSPSKKKKKPKKIIKNKRNSKYFI